MKNPRHCTPHNGKFTFQLTILGHPCRTSAHFDTIEECSVSCDLVKHYLRAEFKLDIPASLDGEHFSCLAYSRRGVNLSDSTSVFKSLPEDMRDFISKHRAELEAHRDNQPPEPDYVKWGRHAPSMENPAMREWVRACERADLDARAFKEIDHGSFFLRLRVVQNSFETAIKSLKLALRMHEGVTNEKLVNRRIAISALIEHFIADANFVRDFSASLKTECEAVSTAVSKLEAAKPVIT